MLSRFLKEICARFVDLLGYLVKNEKTEDNIPKQNSSNKLKKDKLYTQLVSILKDLVSCYQEKMELENTPAWIELITIDNLCELGYHFFQCVCLLSLFDESLLETSLFKFLDLVLPTFPPFHSIQEEDAEELTKEQTQLRKYIMELKILSKSIYTYCDTVSEDEAHSDQGMRTIQQYIHLLKSTLKDMTATCSSSEFSIPKPVETEIRPETKINQMTSGSEEDTMFIYEGESERPIETTARPVMFGAADVMAPPSVIAEIHNQIFHRNSNERRELSDNLMRQSLSGSLQRKTKKETQNQKADEEQEEEYVYDYCAVVERTEETEAYHREFDRSIFLVYSVNSYDPFIGLFAFSDCILNYIIKNYQNTVLFEAYENVTYIDTQTILNRINSLRYMKKLIRKGYFSINGGVIRYRNRYKNGSAICAVMQAIVNFTVLGRSIEVIETAVFGMSELTHRCRHYRIPNVVQARRKRAASPRLLTDRPPKNGGGEGNGISNEGGATNEFSEGMRSEDLLHHITFYPLPQIPFNNHVSLSDYFTPDCPVSNKHAQNMIQILIIKCTT